MCSLVGWRLVTDICYTASLTKTVLHQRPHPDRFHYWQISVVVAGLDGLCLSFHSLTISSWVVCRQCKLWATTHKLVGEPLFWRLLVLQVVSNWSLGPCPIWTLMWWTFGCRPSICTPTDFQLNIRLHVKLTSPPINRIWPHLKVDKDDFYRKASPKTAHPTRSRSWSYKRC